MTVAHHGEEDQGAEDVDARGDEGFVSLLGELRVLDLAVVLNEKRVGLTKAAPSVTWLGAQWDIIVQARDEAGLLADAWLQLVGVERVVLLRDGSAAEASVNTDAL